MHPFYVIQNKIIELIGQQLILSTKGTKMHFYHNTL